MRSSLRPKPSEVVNETVPASRSRRPIGATAVTTAPPAGVTYASAAVRSPPITSSIASDHCTGAGIPQPYARTPDGCPRRQLCGGGSDRPDRSRSRNGDSLPHRRADRTPARAPRPQSRPAVLRPDPAPLRSVPELVAHQVVGALGPVAEDRARVA